MRTPIAPFLVACCLLAAPALCVDSGGFRGPQRNGIFAETGLMAQWPDGGPKLLWKYDGLGRGLSSPCVANGMVYVVGGVKPASLFAFTLDGELKWKKEYGGEFDGSGRFQGSRSTPMVRDGVVIVGSAKGVIYAMDAATGEPKWTVDLTKDYGYQVAGWGNNATPLLVGDLVINNTRNGANPMVALKLQTGEKAWVADPGKYANDNSSATYMEHGDAKLIFHQYWWAIAANDAATGKEVWSTKISAGGTTTPVVSDGYAFCILDSGAACMYHLEDDGKTFTELWRRDGISSISQAVILNGKVFAFGRSEKSKPFSWLALDLKTGNVLKEQPCADEGAVVAADGLLYFLEAGERHWRTPKISLVKPTPDGFEVVSSFTPLVGTLETWTHPVIAEGRMFLRHGDLLAAYDLRPADK